MEAGNLPLVDHEVMIEMVETPKELPITDFQVRFLKILFHFSKNEVLETLIFS